ncbi:MAG TPA: MATE family efflux transporter [Clostridiales bacterium]|nr:MATE family efflux transporter [Clostridiales bacterium]
MSNEAAYERELGTKSVGSLIIKYSIAAVLGQSMQICQVVTDGFFVGNGLNAAGLATIAIVIPLLTFALALGCLVGVGATSIAAIHLGRKDVEAARKVYGQSVWYGLFLSVTIAILGHLFAEPIVRLFGATDDLVANCVSYARMFFIFLPFCVMGGIFYFFIRLDEKPFIGTLALTIPVVYAEIIEYFCIFQYDLGVASSAMAFGITVGSWSLIGLYFLMSKKTIFKVKLSDLKFDFKLIANVNKTGMASFLVQVAISFIAIMLNNLLARHGTGMDTAAFGILNAYLMYIFTLFVTLGWTLGMQPVVSFNLGAGKFARVRQALTKTIVYNTIFMAVVTVLVFIFSDFIIGFFAGDDLALIAASKSHIYVFLSLFAFGSASFIVSGYYQAIELNGRAVFHALTRNVIFIVPVSLIMLKLFGVAGVWASMPVCEVLAFIVAMLFVFHEVRRLKSMEQAL